MNHNLSCVIIDDEPSGRIVLKELLKKFFPGIVIRGEASDVSEAEKEIISAKPDFIFLDVQMPGGNGFELLKRFHKIDFEVVFVTSYEKYAIDAIRFSALDYILKPVEIADFKNCIERIRKLKADKLNSQPLIVNLLKNIDSEGDEKNIAIHHKDKVKLIRLKEISHIEAAGNYTNVYISSGQKYTPARLLRDFEDFLEDHSNFVRISKSVILNLDYVSEYSKGEPCILYLKNGSEYEVSRRKKTEIIEKLKK
jgi:two-component system, LytTR family, response regulator